MKFRFTCGIAALLGLAARVGAIEPPVTPAPIPPTLSPEEAAKPAPARELPPADPDGQEGVADAAGPEGPGEPMEIPAVRPAYLGVGGYEVPELLREHLQLGEGQGIVVRSIDPGGPAATAGVQENDIITRIAGSPVGSHEDLREKVGTLKPGEETALDFIHRGEPRSVRITVAEAPVAIPGAMARRLPPVERLMLDGMPQDQARRIQDAIQQNLNAFERFERGERMGGQLRQHLEDMQRMMEDAEGQADQPGQREGGIHLRSSGTVRMLNTDGSGIEVYSENGGKQIRILGAGGAVEWEGPYDTPQDREAVPKAYRERIENLNIDMNFKGQGLRFRVGPATDE